MPELTITPRPALAGASFGRFGAAAPAPGITLTALAEGHLLHLLAKPGDGDLLPVYAGALSPYGSRIAATGPGQWFAAGDRVLTPGDLADIATLLSPRTAISDQSHGRVRIGVSGPDLRRLLAKSVAVDLHDAAFPVGHAATMLAGHVSINLARLSETAYEIIVLRGFAADLWESLRHQAFEFGVECRRPD